MSYYKDVYLKRVNRFGEDPQSRIQNQRIKLFEDLLLKSIYRVDFSYLGTMHPGLLERMKQDDSEILQYLLTRVDLVLPGGTLLDIEDQHGNTKRWMVYYLEYIETSGYNRYIVMDMSHTIKWTHELGAQNPKYFQSSCYFFGKRRATKKGVNKNIKNEGMYLEEADDYSLVLPYNKDLKRDDYFEVVTGKTTQGFRVTGYDIVSTEGVEFITADPVYIYDKSPDPVPNVQEPAAEPTREYDWFTGDFKED